MSFFLTKVKKILTFKWKFCGYLEMKAYASVCVQSRQTNLVAKRVLIF